MPHQGPGIAGHMHQHRLQQNAFLTRHGFIGEVNGKPDLRLNDFEKAEHRTTVESTLMQDQDTFNRRSPAFRANDRLRFLLACHEVPRVNARVMKTWKRLVARLRRKRRNLLSAP